MNLVDLVTLPARVALAFGEASLGIARLVEPDGPVHPAYKAGAMTGEGVCSAGRSLPGALSTGCWTRTAWRLD